MEKFFLLFYLIGVVLTASLNNGLIHQGRIVGGTKSNISQFPFTVSIKANNGSASSSSFCGGSIIAQNYILTAAHCTRGFNNFEIGIGSTLVQKAFMSISIHSEAIEHPDFNPKNLNNDISLIKIPDLPLNAPNIVPVRLPKRSQFNQTFVGMPSIVSGFGRTSDASNNISPYMQHVQLRVIPNKECQKMYGSKVVTENVLCARGKDKNYAACLGDSGSPLVINMSYTPVQIGIVSFVSSRGCENDDPSGYTRVNKYLDWISEITGKQIED